MTMMEDIANLRDQVIHCPFISSTPSVLHGYSRMPKYIECKQRNLNQTETSSYKCD